MKVRTCLMALLASTLAATLASGTQLGLAQDSYDFEVHDLAADRSISLSEAAERLQWQKAAMGLDATLRQQLSDAFGGMWIDVAAGDRVRVATTTTGGDAARDRARQVLREAGLGDVSDVVTVTWSERELRRRLDATVAELADVNQGASELLGAEVLVADNDIALRIPVGAALTREQQDYVRKHRSQGRAAHERETKGSDEACSISGFLHCDPPMRGGTRFTSIAGGCTVGFFARSRTDSKPYFVTAGHCFDGTNGAFVVGYNSDDTLRDYGYVHNYKHTKDVDFGLVRLEGSTWNPGPYVAVLNGTDTTLNLQYSIKRDEAIYKGMRICYTGSHSMKTDCGEVTGVDVYDGYSFENTANYCGSITGDSGGSLYSLNSALGIHLGSYSTCNKYFEAIRTVEDGLNVNIVHAP